MTVENLNQRRFELLQKGWVNKKEIEQFVPCGQRKAHKIYEACVDEDHMIGIEKLEGTVLRTKRLMKFMGLTESEIIRNANKKAADA